MIAVLLLQVAIQRDTVVTVPARDAVDLAIGLAAFSIAATFLVLCLALVVALLKVRQAARALKETKRKVATDRGIESLRKVAANMEAMSDTLRGEVAELSESVTHLSERLDQASDRMEERIEEFNALMEVVQAEAESAFVDGAATARGVRAGLGNLGRGRAGRKEPARSPAAAGDLEKVADRTGSAERAGSHPGTTQPDDLPRGPLETGVSRQPEGEARDVVLPDDKLGA